MLFFKNKTFQMLSLFYVCGIKKKISIWERILFLPKKKKKWDLFFVVVL